MLRTNTKEIIVAAVLLLLSVFLLNPLGWWMPSDMVMLTAAGLVAVFAAYASFALRERARDEREAMLGMHASRVAFLAGSGILALGIIIQGLNHRVDPWLVASLAGMVIVKLISRLFVERHN